MCGTVAQGNLSSCSSASHPVGSTIRVKDFLKSIPVRKQTALKNAVKTLSTIRKLLQTYALARGTVRLSLKVLKGKNDKANWQYSPIDNADGLRAAAVRVIGNDVAGKCEVRTKTTAPTGSNDEHSDLYSVVALLATIDEGILQWCLILRTEQLTPAQMQASSTTLAIMSPSMVVQ